MYHGVWTVISHVEAPIPEQGWGTLASGSDKKLALPLPDLYLLPWTEASVYRFVEQAPFTSSKLMFTFLIHLNFKKYGAMNPQAQARMLENKLLKTPLPLLHLEAHIGASILPVQVESGSSMVAVGCRWLNWHAVFATHPNFPNTLFSCVMCCLLGTNTTANGAGKNAHSLFVYKNIKLC